MLTESIALNGYSIRADKTIRLSFLHKITRDNGDIVSSSAHEEVVVPGQDVTDRDQEIQDICALIWTPEVIAAYQAPRGNE